MRKQEIGTSEFSILFQNSLGKATTVKLARKNYSHIYNLRKCWTISVSVTVNLCAIRHATVNKIISFHVFPQ